MRPIGTLGPAALAALFVIALLFAPAARAEETALCKVNENPCASGNRLSSLHLTLTSGSIWLVQGEGGPTLNFLCLSVLAQVKVGSPGAPQEIEATALTFSNCGAEGAGGSHSNCTIKSSASEASPIHTDLLKTAAGLGELEFLDGKIEAKCVIFGFIKLECTYGAEGLDFHVTARNGSNGHGMVNSEGAVLPVEGGALCPESSEITTGLLEPSEDVYLGGPYESHPVAADELLGPGNPAAPNVERCTTGSLIDCASGNLIQSQTDISPLGGRGPKLELTRTYNSQLAAKQTEAGTFGYGWTVPYGASLTIDNQAGTATVRQGNGATAVFYLSGGNYVAEAWVQAKLAKEGESYIFTLPSQEKLEFNKSGQLNKIIDRHKNALTLTYKEGLLETVKDAAGRALTFTYKEGKVESIKDPMGNTVKYTYESGNLATATLPGEASANWKFKYDASHQLTELIDGRGYATKYEYDGSNRVKTQKDALERERKLEYKAGETTITEPNSSKTLEKFNAMGEPTEVTRAYGTELAQTTKYKYDGSYRLSELTDANNHTTTYGYDAESNRKSEKDASGNETNWTYNSTHDVLTETTPKKNTTTYVRNAAGDPEVIKRPAPGSKTQETKLKWASNGDLEEEVDPLEQETTFEYDTYGNLKAEKTPTGDKRTWGHNEDGRVVSEVSPRGYEAGKEPAEYETEITRDAQGRPEVVTDPLGHKTKRKYDAAGNLEVLTNPNEHATTITYDKANQRTKAEYANGNTAKTDYDSMGRVKSRTDGNNHTTTYERNLLEQVKEVIDPLERKTTMEYDAAGNLKKTKDPENRTITYSYYDNDWLKKVDYSDASTADVTYEYGEDGEVKTMKDGTGTTEKTYDELDRLTEVENGAEEVVAYKYNLANQITEITYPNGKVVTQGFDEAGRLKSVKDWLGGETKFAYNRDSALKTTTFPAASENVDEYAYDEAGQLEATAMKRGAVTLASISYARDKAGQLETATQTGLPGAAEVKYKYDKRERLEEGAGTSFEYDPANNPTKLGATKLEYDGASQLKKAGTTKYVFNSMGERTEAKPETGPVTKYGYDQAGNLISTNRTEEGEVKKIEDTYAYDGSGLRSSQKISGVKAQLSWDVSGGLPLLLYDGANYYIYGPEGLPIEQIAGETAVYLHHDHLGSTRLLTNSSGEAKGKYTYTPYGSVEQSGEAKTPLGFNGQYRNESTGLLYLRARTYDPTTAQFMSVDPRVTETGEAYGYAKADPVNAGDPSGEQVRTPLPSRQPNTPQQPQQPPADGVASVTMPGYFFSPSLGLYFITPGAVVNLDGTGFGTPGVFYYPATGAFDVGAGRIIMNGVDIILPAYGYNPTYGFYVMPGGSVNGNGVSMTPPGYRSNPWTREYHVTAGRIETANFIITTPAYGYIPGVGYYATPSSIERR